MMNVGITTFGCDGGQSGIGRYTVNLIKQLSACTTPANYHLYMYQDEREVFASGLKRPMQMDLFPNWLKRPVANVAWHQTRLSNWSRERRHEVLFLPAGNRRLPIHSPCPTVGTVHDFSSVHIKGKYDPARMFYIKHVLPFLTRRLTHVLTVSESSKRDIVEYANVPPERITVTPLAVDHQRERPDPDEAKKRLSERLTLDQPYLLYVSRIEHPGKNHVRLIEAFERLKSSGDFQHQLVLAGGDWTGAKVVHERADRSPYAKDIRFTGFVSDDDLMDLYSCAEMLVFPSLYEGFGLPVLEAMACGTPVASADVSSLPEVGGDAVSYFSPNDSDSICDAIRRLLEDTDYRQLCVDRGLERSRKFTWAATAKKTFQTLQSVAQR